MSDHRYEKCCKDKFAYRAYTIADRALVSLRRAKKHHPDAKHLHVYRCPFGAHWHIGHSRTPKR